VTLDPARGELALHNLVQPRAERLDVARLVGGPGQVDIVSDAFPAQPGLEHEHDLVERAGALVVRRDDEQHRSPPPDLRFQLDPPQPCAEGLHLRRCPDGLRELAEPRDLVWAHRRTGGEDEEVVRQAGAVLEIDRPPVRIDLGNGALVEPDVPAPQRPRQRDVEPLLVAAEGDVDRVGLEEERWLLGDDRQVDLVTQPLAKGERGLQSGEPTAQDHDTWPRREPKGTRPRNLRGGPYLGPHRVPPSESLLPRR
jgi:hypothetical protein